ncbi:hypothetical protein PFISCL1PPCAC_22863, partial [Pristionchus fissidentatus]
LHSFYWHNRIDNLTKKKNRTGRGFYYTLFLRPDSPDSCRRALLFQNLLVELLHSRLQFGPEVSDQTLDGPSGGVSEGADGVSLDLLAQLPDHVNLLLLRLAVHEPPHHLVQPVAALATRRALSTALVLVEERETGDALHDVGLLVHHNHGGSSESGLGGDERVKVHQHVVAHALGHERNRGSSGDDGQQVVPAANDAAAVALDELLERDGHLLLHRARVIHLARDAEQLGSPVSLPSKAGEPLSSSAADGGRDGDRLHVGNSRGTAEETNIGGERRLQTGLALLAFDRLDKSRLLSANVRSHSTVDKDVEVVASSEAVLAEETRLQSLVDGLLENDGFVVELSTDVDVGSTSAHCHSSDEAALNELVRVVSHDLAILARSRLSLVSVNYEVLRTAIEGLLHESPLHSGRETGSSATAQSRGGHLLQNPVLALENDFLRLVPISSLHGSLETVVVAAVQIGEDTVLILEVSVGSLLWLLLSSRAEGAEGGGSTALRKKSRRQLAHTRRHYYRPAHS